MPGAEVHYEKVVSGVGNILINNTIIGGIEGDVVMASTFMDLPIDFISQYPGVELGRLRLSKKYFLRLTMVEGTLENLAKALDCIIEYRPDVTPVGYKIISGGSQSINRYVPEHTLTIYGWGEDGKPRKFYAYKIIFVDPGEINIFPASLAVKIPVTLMLLPNILLPSYRDTWYLEEEI